MSSNYCDRRRLGIKYYRSAFFNFHRDFRAQRQRCGGCCLEPASITAAMAGQEWQRLPWINKLRYILQARNAKYVNAMKVKEAHDVLESLTKAIVSEDEIDLVELQRTAMYMQRLKQAVNVDEIL